jgi:hypothetical protein
MPRRFDKPGWVLQVHETPTWRVLFVSRALPREFYGRVTVTRMVCEPQGVAKRTV